MMMRIAQVVKLIREKQKTQIFLGFHFSSYGLSLFVLVTLFLFSFYFVFCNFSCKFWFFMFFAFVGTWNFVLFVIIIWVLTYLFWIFLGICSWLASKRTILLWGNDCKNLTLMGLLLFFMKKAYLLYFLICILQSFHVNEVKKSYFGTLILTVFVHLCLYGGIGVSAVFGFVFTCMAFN